MTDATVLDGLFKVIESRKGKPLEDSYTAQLFHEGTERIARKVGEEAIETIIAAIAEKPDEVVTESADLLYHLLVLWSQAGIDPDQIWHELAAREGITGLDEKASRDDL